MKNHPRVFDPYDEHMRDEVVAGRVVLTLDEVEKLYWEIDDLAGLNKDICGGGELRLMDTKDDTKDEKLQKITLLAQQWAADGLLISETMSAVKVGYARAKLANAESAKPDRVTS